MLCLSGECSDCKVRLVRGVDLKVITRNVTTPMRRIYWNISSSHVKLEVEHDSKEGYMSFDDLRFHNGSSRSSRFCKGELLFKQYNCKCLHLERAHLESSHHLHSYTQMFLVSFPTISRRVVILLVCPRSEIHFHSFQTRACWPTSGHFVGASSQKLNRDDASTTSASTRKRKAFLFLVLASSRFTRGLCLCLRHSCK